jgi:DNA-binding response OmpR family regulator
MEPTSQFAPRVLLAIDDLRLRRTNEAGLRAAGFAVSAPGDAEAVSVLADSFSPDVLVVDTEMQSSESHRPLYQDLRTATDRYLLCIDSLGRERARVEILRSGADDAVSIPVSADEIAARCHALLRRPREMRTDWDPVQQTVINLGPLMIDTGRHEIRFADQEIAATRIEFSLLEHLCRRPTEVASRTDLLESVWGPNWVGDTHVVDVHLSNLRRKLDKVTDLTVIHTVRGVGFRVSNDLLDAAESQVTLAAAPEPAPKRETAPIQDDRLSA